MIKPKAPEPTALVTRLPLLIGLLAAACSWLLVADAAAAGRTFTFEQGKKITEVYRGDARSCTGEQNPDGTCIPPETITIDGEEVVPDWWDEYTYATKVTAVTKNLKFERCKVKRSACSVRGGSVHLFGSSMHRVTYYGRNEAAPQTCTYKQTYDGVVRGRPSGNGSLRGLGLVFGPGGAVQVQLNYSIGGRISQLAGDCNNNTTIQGWGFGGGFFGKLRAKSDTIVIPREKQADRPTSIGYVSSGGKLFGSPD